MSKEIAVQGGRLKALLETPEMKKKFNEVLGKKSNAFMSSIVSAVNQNPSLRKCEPMSVASSAMTAATLDLPITPGLGFAHIVPYKDKAQFQLGWKGYIQLAMRSGQYKTINVTPVKEGQVKSYNPFTGEMEFNFESTGKTKVGYLLYFKLINGYEKYFYMTKEECEAHGKRYSRTYAKGTGRWAQDFDAMALKTVAKQGLSKYGILSVDMQQAFVTDDSALGEDGEPEFIDAPEAEEPKPAKKKAKKKTSSKLKDVIDVTPDPKAQEELDESWPDPEDHLAPSMETPI